MLFQVQLHVCCGEKVKKTFYYYLIKKIKNKNKNNNVSYDRRFENGDNRVINNMPEGKEAGNDIKKHLKVAKPTLIWMTF